MQKLSGLSIYLIEEVQSLPQQTKVRLCGTVLAINRQCESIVLIINDSTASIYTEIPIEQDQQNNLHIPNSGDSIALMGQIIKRQLGGIGKETFKIRILTYRVITAEQEIELMSRAILMKRKRIVENCHLSNIVNNKPIDYYSIKKINILDIKTLILVILYATLQSNPDLTNVQFTEQTILNSSFTKQFMTNKQINTTQMVYAFQQAIVSLLKDPLCKESIVKKEAVVEKKSSKKGKIQKQEIAKFIIYKPFYIRIEIRLYDYIRENKSQGITTIQLTKMFHQDHGIISQQHYVFSQKLLFPILSKLIMTNRVYKTSQNLLYPRV